MEDRYHVAYKHTYVSYKEVVPESVGTLEHAAWALAESMTSYWVKTGPVWTNLQSGTQMCIEHAYSRDYIGLAPEENKRIADIMREAADMLKQ